MAEVLVEFDAAFPGPDGAAYTPKACTRLNEDGLWEGWIEFSNVKTGTVIRSARETTQPTRADAMYWATGLSRIYLEGALARALAPTRVLEPHQVDSEPAFERPAPSLVPASAERTPRTVLDPFEVYAQGERVLRQELSALDADHLRAIIRAYGLEGGAGAHSPLPDVLAGYIVAEVSARMGGPPAPPDPPGDADWLAAR